MWAVFGRSLVDVDFCCAGATAYDVDTGRQVAGIDRCACEIVDQEGGIGLVCCGVAVFRNGREQGGVA